MSPRGSRLGFLYALLAYASWGVFPIYWKLFGRVSPIEVISHRVVWSLALMLGFTVASGQWSELRRVFGSARRWGVLFVTASLLSFNWGVFVYGVVSGQIIQTSLGYFLNPLFTVVLGVVFLKERLNRLQILAVIMAVLGVLLFGWHLGRVPWIAIGLAVTFGFYGLLRKIVEVTPLAGLTIETALMVPFAIGCMAFLSARQMASFGSSASSTLLFLGAGVVTTLPLLWFNSAAKLLPLATLGFLQYLAPTLQLLCGVVLYQEAFTLREGVSFLLIWAAIAVFVLSLPRVRTATPVPNAD